MFDYEVFSLYIAARHLTKNGNKVNWFASCLKQALDNGHSPLHNGDSCGTKLTYRKNSNIIRTFV